MLQVAAVVALFVRIGSVGGYHAYHFTESVEFCGLVCHQVMKPEYVAYKHSPHARVSCVECHIGSGAGWYVKSKMSGLRQVFAMLTKTYELPVETPVANLRPARDTCEACHWPEKISGSLEKKVWRFAYDAENTPMRYRLLLRVGSGSDERLEPHGIHWHVSRNEKVEYFALDKQRMDIPWVRVTHADGTSEEFRRDDAFRLPLFIGGHTNAPGGLSLPAKVVIDRDNVDRFRRYAAPGFEIEQLILDSAVESG